MTGIGRDVASPQADPARDLVSIVSTSGTKSVELTHRNLFHPAFAAAECIRLSPEDRIVGVAALFHVFGFGPGVLGSANRVRPWRFRMNSMQPSACISSSPAEPRCTTGYRQSSPPSCASSGRGRATSRVCAWEWSRAPPAGYPLTHGLGGALLHAPHRDSLTEASSLITMTTLEDSIARRMGPVGRTPNRGYERMRARPGGQRAAAREPVGDRCPRTGGHAGLYRQPGETLECFTPSGHFRRGDIGIVEDDSYVHLVSRGGGVIIRCGSNVYPREIEDRLLAHAAVQRFAGLGLQDKFLGKRSVPRSIPWRGRSSPKRRSGSGAGRVSPNTKVPDRVLFLGEFPMTGTGKVRRVELVRLLEEARPHPVA